MNKNRESSNIKSTKKLYKIIFILVTAVGVLVFFVQSRFIWIIELKNGEYFNSKYRIIQENFYHPRLQLLRKREDLDKVVSSGNTQFEKIILLRKWAKQQWSGGSCFYYPPWDAVEILDLARKYKNYGFCAQYAFVFLQACQSLGIHARYVDLLGHFVTEVWSDNYNRWIIMDPSNNMHFEKDGILLSGRDLCSAYWSKKIKGIRKVNSNGIRTKVSINDLACYKMYSILLRSDHLSNPKLIEVNGKPKILTIEPNYRNYPLISRDKIRFGRDMMGNCTGFLAWKAEYETEFFNEKEHSGKPDDFRHVENQTIIMIDEYYKNKGIVKIVLLSENSPTFKTFLTNVDNTELQENKDRITWHLKPGFNKFAARIFTEFGWLCNESYIKILYKPSWLFKS